MKRAKTENRHRFRIMFVFALTAALFAILAVRLGWHMIIKGEEYADQARRQQTLDTTIPATRGKIVDSKGNELAISATTNTVWIRPESIKNNGETPEECELNTQLEAKALSEILSMSYEKVMEVIDSDKRLLKLAKNVDDETAEKIREQAFVGVEISIDAKRYYPLGAFASHILGSTTDDNVGLSGIELEYNSKLSGLDGRWIKNKDIRKNTLAYGRDSYFGAEDGYTVRLTLDQNIQYIAMQEIAACKERTQSKKVACLIMDPKTFEILACAQTGEYDPNDPRAPLAEDAEAFAGFSDEEKLIYWNQQWRNSLINDTYEPGSTFKLLTTAIALDEGVTYPGEKFTCDGKIQVADWEIKCWYYPRKHGVQTLSQAVQNSCNPVMVELSRRIGLTKYYEGLDAFGVTERTGVDFPGEGSNILQPKSTAGPVGLATMSYGQGIAVTPISLLSSVCSMANKGYLMQPHFVSELLDSEGNSIMKVEPKIKSRSISEQTASDMLSIMEEALLTTGGGRLKVPGYRIGGKTGTANKPEGGGYSETDVYGSFIGVAPVDDPKFCILVICDTPKDVLYGSLTAGPCAINIMERVLHYMGIAPQYSEEELKALNKSRIKVPDLVGKDAEDAMGLLEAQGLSAQLSPAIETNASLIVVDQFPKPGTEVSEGYEVTLYYEILSNPEDEITSDIVEEDGGEQ